MRAVFREGLGHYLAPNQTFDIIDDLPIQSLLPLSEIPTMPWPQGDLYKTKLPKYIDSDLLM
jgi:hypothetical protein